MSDDALPVTLAGVHVYPIKSCGGIAAREALLVETGLEFDRAWMLVDAHGEFVSQRELPRLALVQPQLRTDDMVLRAPGMLALHVALDGVRAVGQQLAEEPLAGGPDEQRQAERRELVQPGEQLPVLQARLREPEAGGRARAPRARPPRRRGRRPDAPARRGRR